MEKSIFSTLNIINLSVKTTQNKPYIPWMILWSELCKVFPNATYKFHEDINGFPYINTPLGLFVKVSVTVNDLTHTITRPIYSNAMKSMKTEPYEYNTRNGIKTVEAAVASDVNDALFRSLSKAIAMFGLGTFVFKGEQYADAELLDSSQISEISNLIAQNKLMLSDLNAVFGINKLSELMAMNYDGAIRWIEDNKK